MGKSRKAGRKKRAGDRFPCGKLRQPHDYGNDRRVALMATFRPYQEGKADQWVAESAIGRAWAVELLDGFDVDGAAIRDAGLNYAARYWGHYQGGAKVANYEGNDRRGGFYGDDPEDPRGETFRRLDDAIRSAGRASYDAVHSLVLDHHWFPHENPAWLDRLINERLLRKGRPVAGQLPHDGDYDKLRLAAEGLLTIVAGKQKKVA